MHLIINPTSFHSLYIAIMIEVYVAAICIIQRTLSGEGQIRSLYRVPHTFYMVYIWLTFEEYVP